METPNHWYFKPSKKVLIIFITIWFIGNFLNLAVASDLFSKRPSFNSGIWALVVSSTGATFTLFINYLKNKKENESKHS